MDRQFSWNLGTYASLTSFHPTVCKCTMPLHKWTGQGTFQASEYSAAKLSRLQHGQSLKANTKWTFMADEYCVGPVGTNRPAHTNKFLMKHTDSRFCHWSQQRNNLPIRLQLTKHPWQYAVRRNLYRHSAWLKIVLLSTPTNRRNRYKYGVWKTPQLYASW